MSERQFDGEFPDDATWGEIYGPAMDVQTEAEAEAYLARIISLMRRKDQNLSEEGARYTALSNVGYWTGYCSDETAERVKRLYHTTHPIFGDAKLTTEELLRMGIEYGERRKRDIQ